MAEGQERTEQATPRKRREARERGQVPKSADVNAVFVFLTVLLLGRAMMLRQTDGTLRLFRSEWANLADPNVVATLPTLALTSVRHFIALVAPFVLAAGAAALAANVLQVGFMVTGKVMSLDLNRINPLQGAKRLVSMRGAVELIKTLLKILLVGYAAYGALWGRREMLFVLPEQTVAGVMLIVGEIAFHICLRGGIMLLLLAMADYGYQRWQFEKDLRMSRQEIRDEYKRTEGDPLLRQRIRQRQREVAQRRMMSEVPGADVVVTNPTHIAVALRYDPASMRAPIVVAKGQRLIAERIRTIAQGAGVTIIENPPLARALHAQVEVDREIPVELYEAVSEILAYVYRIKGTYPGQRAA
jgi:flagellar biosynthesis protein FlhB